MKLKAKHVLVFAVMASLMTPSFASNDAMIDLLKVLRDNGTISEDAYSVLANSVKADEEKTQASQNETKDSLIAEIAAATEKTKWAEKIKLKGDLRLRRQYSDYKDDDAADPESRVRYRYRFRLGATGQVNDQLKVGAGFASGGDDPRSTNETLDDTFETKDIRLDYAFVEYSPVDYASIVAGKFKRKDYLWAPTDLLWDGDINPEGMSVKFKNKSSAGETYLSGGVWILDEYSDTKDDPMMSYAQLGHKFQSGNMFGNVAGTLYRFKDIEGGPALDHASGTNTLAAGNYVNDYDSLGLSAELGTTAFAGKMFAVFGDYIKNSDGDDDKGYAVGFKFGDKKVKDRNQWQFKYIYADLERDAWLDAFPGSDRFGGLTGVKGNEFVFNYGLHKNVVFGVDYYDTEQDISGFADDNDKEKVLQTDLIFKF